MLSQPPPRPSPVLTISCVTVSQLPAANTCNWVLMSLWSRSPAGLELREGQKSPEVPPWCPRGDTELLTDSRTLVPGSGGGGGDSETLSAGVSQWDCPQCHLLDDDLALAVLPVLSHVLTFPRGFLRSLSK